METTLRRFERWLETNAPEYLAGLGPGATTVDLVRAEGALGFRLDDDVAALYRWRNGDPQHDGVLTFWRCFLPLDRAVERWEGLCEMMESGEWADHDGYQDPSIWSRGWLPICTWDSGFNLCFDDAGCYGGDRGQIVCAWLKDDNRDVVAPSLSAWLDAHVDGLEAGLWRFVEDAGQWEADYDELVAFLADRLPGYPKRMSSADPLKD